MGGSAVPPVNPFDEFDRDAAQTASATRGFSASMAEGVRCVVVFGQHLTSNLGHHDDLWFVTTHYLCARFLVLAIEDLITLRLMHSTLVRRRMLQVQQRA